ncbi:hypothetical protein [Sporosarcina luteola]|uniref:hypothetical protein n=1 Tax=Sporosarcina luteola TaxID=582850 RepID=UPI00204086FD|nr:hypothetical protein [Sporosarcina luteola]MCM3711317.1 hypothetical protein [Sporosarcina luteola]
MRCKNILPVGLMLLVLLWWKPLDVSACSCIMPPSPEEALDKADAVFSGEVVEIVENKKFFGGAYGRTVHLKVDKAWKGIKESETSITTGYDDGDCGYSFEKGQKYLVYASASNMYVPGTLSTTICHRTTELSNAAEDLNELGEGQEVSNDGSQEETLDEGIIRWWVFGLFVLGLLAIFLGFRYKNKRKKARG